MQPRAGQPSTSVAKYGWVASPVKAGLRPPPPAAEGLDRACHPAFICHQAFDGKVRLTTTQVPCQLFSLRQIYADSDNHPQGPTFRISMPKYPTKDPNYRILAHQRSRFTHYYFYIRDEVLGPMVMRVASFFPFQTTYYLNGPCVQTCRWCRAGLPPAIDLGADIKSPIGSLPASAQLPATSCLGAFWTPAASACGQARPPGVQKPAQEPT
jgi:hypothetical protein